MPTTTNYTLPYPADSDPVDVAGDVQLLAEAVDVALGNAGGVNFPDVFLMMGA